MLKRSDLAFASDSEPNSPALAITVTVQVRSTGRAADRVRVVIQTPTPIPVTATVTTPQSFPRRHPWTTGRVARGFKLPAGGLQAQAWRTDRPAGPGPGRAAAMQ